MTRTLVQTSTRIDFYQTFPTICKIIFARIFIIYWLTFFELFICYSIIFKIVIEIMNMRDQEFREFVSTL